MTRILVAEDDPDLALGLKNNLEIEGYDVRVARDGAEALALALQWQPALLVLDLVMPKMEGMRVLRELRGARHRVAVLILTARGEEADKVRGLKLGADDYVTKPFGLLELLARVESLLRRARASPPGDCCATPAIRRRRSRSCRTPRPQSRRRSRASARRNTTCCSSCCAIAARCAPARSDADGLGLLVGCDHAHSRHAHVRTASQTRSRRRAPAAHNDDPRHRLSPRRLAGKSRQKADCPLNNCIQRGLSTDALSWRP